MASGFDKAIDEAISTIVTGLSGLEIGKFPKIVGWLNAAHNFEVRYEKAVINGQEEWQAFAIASSGATTELFTGAVLQTTLTAAAAAGVIAVPEALPATAVFYSAGTILNTQAAALTGDGTAIIVERMVNSSIWEDEVKPDVKWQGKGQGESQTIKIISGDDETVNDRAEIIIEPTSNGFDIKVDSTTVVDLSKLLETFGVYFENIFYDIPDSGAFVNLSMDGEKLVAFVGHDGEDMLSVSNDVDLVLLGRGDDVLGVNESRLTVDGGDGTDAISYQNVSSGIDIDLGAGTTYFIRNAPDGVPSGQPKDIFDSIENVTGTAFDDVILGDKVDNTIYGSSGRDVIDGGAGYDTLDYSAATEMVRVNVTDGQTATNVERIVGAKNQHNIIVAADDQVQVIVGGEETDSLTALNGAALIGGGGQDIFNLAAGTFVMDAEDGGAAQGDFITWGPYLLSGGWRPL